uniref:Uncharacterized protein n=1 Tax=viral metagenome TaxID=1070528 RepID=A0A6C0HS50_9ZZZZ
MNKICFYSSFIFVTNIVYTLFNKQYIYAFLFTYLLFTSVLIHYYEDGLFLNLLDKTAICGLLIYSIYNYCNIIHKNYRKIKKTFRSTYKKQLKKLKRKKEIKTLLGEFTPRQNRILFKNKNKKGVTIFVLLFLPIAFVFEVYLFYYGYLSCNYCYHSDKILASIYHSLLHLVACLSFHMLTYIL